MSILNELSELVIKGDLKNVKAKTQQAVDDGIDAQVILDEGLMPGINEIGERFAQGKVFVPNVLVAAKTMNAGVDVIRPLLEGKGDTSIGTAVVGTVKGDLHDIGKNLCVLMLNSANIKTVDLGANVSSETYIEAIKEYKPDVAVLSALLTTTMNEQGRIIKAFEEAGIRSQVKVMVGGAPVTQEWADKINADVFTADAAECAKWAKNYIESK